MNGLVGSFSALGMVLRQKHHAVKSLRTVAESVINGKYRIKRRAVAAERRPARRVQRILVFHAVGSTWNDLGLKLDAAVRLLDELAKLWRGGRAQPVAAARRPVGHEVKSVGVA